MTEKLLTGTLSLNTNKQMTVQYLPHHYQLTDIRVQLDSTRDSCVRSSAVGSFRKNDKLTDHVCFVYRALFI